MQNVIPMSSSATGSGRDGDDPSVNQDAVRTFEFGNNGMELDSLSVNVDPRYNFSDRNHQPATASNNEVIVLIDSDEEDDVVINGGSAYNENQTDGGVNFPLHPPGINPYSEDPHTVVGGSLGSGLFTNIDDDYDMRLWQFSSETQGGPRFQLFAYDVDDLQGLVGLEPGQLNCAPAISSGYTIAPETSMPYVPMFPESVGRCEADANNGLLDNPLAFSREDPSLQIFLPTRPDT